MHVSGAKLSPAAIQKKSQTDAILKYVIHGAGPKTVAKQLHKAQLGFDPVQILNELKGKSLYKGFGPRIDKIIQHYQTYDPNADIQAPKPQAQPLVHQNELFAERLPVQVHNITSDEYKTSTFSDLKGLTDVLTKTNEQTQETPAETIIKAFADNDPPDMDDYIRLSMLCKDMRAITAEVMRNPDVKAYCEEKGLINPREIQLIATKALRESMVKDYFETAFYNKLHEETGIPIDDLKSMVFNVGFNRMFSETNDLGMSLYSDIDFKVIVDDKKLEAYLKEHPLARDFRSEIDETLLAATRDFKDMGITLEVQQFTVKDLSKIAEYAQGDDPISDKELNFYSTMIGNFQVIGGDKKAANEALNPIRKRFQRDQNILERIVTQYIASGTDKGSLMLLRNFDSVMKELKATGNTKLYDKFKDHYGGKLLGKQQVTAHRFKEIPGKYLFCRIYDTIQAFDALGAKVSAKTRLEAGHLNLITMKFQNMLSTHLEAQGQDHDTVDAQYDTLTRQQLRELYRDPNYNKEIDQMMDDAVKFHIMTEDTLADIKQGMSPDPAVGLGLFFIAMSQKSRNLAIKLEKKAQSNPI